MVRKLESYLADKARIAQDDSDLTSRSDLRRDRIKAENLYYDLADTLCRIPEKRLAKLGLGDFLLELLAGARRIDSLPARDRALRRVRKELRTLDVAAIQRQLDELDRPRPNAAKLAEGLWTERLLASGDEGLEAFLGDYANADRLQLRTLLRNVAKAKEADRPKASKKLTAALRQVITEATAQLGDAPVDSEAPDVDDPEALD